jgi:tetratricopeptide (TPR) repeat protein
LRVAVLNACEGARSSKQDPFAGSAQTLVQQGIPAVIAMQFEIADDVAQTFAHELYGALADSYPIDAAVTEARKAIFAMGREIEWATPVLYLRAPDGRIFDVDRSAATPATTTVAQPVAETAPGPSVIASQIEPLETMTPKEQSVALLRSAGRALGVGDYAGALDVLEQVRALDPSSPALADLTAMAQGQRAVAETRAQRRAEFREHLDAATSLLARNDLAAASARVTEALRLQPADPEARAVQAQIARKIEEGRLAAVAGRHGTGPERAGMAVGPATPPPHDPVTPGPAGDVHPIPDPQPPARMKAGAPRPAPANDESDLQES